jgi:hypothetical protein
MIGPVQLYEEAKRRFGSLLDVFEVSHDDTVGTELLLGRLGLADHTLHYFKTAEDSFDLDAYKPNGGEGGTGGGFSVVVTPGGTYRSILVMRPLPNAQHANIALFLHELGHVDDFDRGINLVVGKPLDVLAVELHAHRFACNEMRERDMKAPLTFYLAEALRPHLHHSSEAYRGAAEAFVRSGEFASFCRATGGWYEKYLELLRLDGQVP